MTENKNELAKQPQTLEDYLYGKKFQKSLAQICSNTIKPERFCKLALVAFSKTPKLYQCTQASVVKSLMDAAELGLDPSGNLGKAYLVPYGQECQLIVGYRGLIELALRNEKVKSIKAVAVYENDQFEINELAEPPIIHKPLVKGDRGQFILAYAYARFQDGTLQHDWMSKQEIDAIRNRSKAAKSGPWVTDYMEMAKKTVIRRLCKVLPMEVDVLSIDCRDFDSVIDQQGSPVEEPKLGTEALTERLKQRKKVENEQSSDQGEADTMAEAVPDPAPPSDNEGPIIPPEDVDHEVSDYPNKVLPEERYYCKNCQVSFPQPKCPKCFAVKVLDRWGK